jgi:hypothetical protein
MYLETTNSSATLERAGVRDIGLRCLQISVTGFVFMIGTTSAVFHEAGSRCSLKLLLRIELTGWARTSAYSFNTQFGTPSGPEAFLGLSEFDLNKVIDSNRFSSLSRLLRVTAYVLRYINALKKKRTQDKYPVNRNLEQLTASEVKLAELLWIKSIQSLSFGKEISFVISINAKYVNSTSLCESWIVSRR